VANRGCPQRSILGDMAKRRVRGQWQTGGGVFDAQCQVTWQRGGQWQTGGGVFDAQCQVTWQRGGQWQTKDVLNARCWVMWQSGGCEGSGRLGEVSSTLNVK